MEEAKARFVEIGQAYETLNDDQRRAQYDNALRRSCGRGFSSNTPPQSYESYRDAFDETVAGLSETELAAALGVLSIVGSLVGSVVGSRLGNSAGGRILGTAGSLAGSMIASRMAGDAFLSLHQESVARVAYKKECQRCVEQGMPMPEPPPANKWRQALEKTMASVKAQVSQSTSATSSANDSEQQPWHEKMRNHVDNAHTRQAAAAASRTASLLWQRAMEEVQKVSSNGNSVHN